ncbi:MAG: succinyl-diaminopimelate desuccinylase [Micavibrio sp.]|mgnify:CR=1 FL=1|nr:succinyl-diaminopimelate desuccinylase [Micavibrio sp.]|tara:strand:+ start:8021 stop:9169 length:1149 start_codon:yes stop_codon:yes gene_type:complete
MINTLGLAKALISVPSVTPHDKGAQDILKTHLDAAGFHCFDVPFGGENGQARIENLFARFGTGPKHLCYAGHTDVVPPGPEDKWTYGPFTPHVEDGVLYGRGASDMKGSVAAFTVAAIKFVQNHPDFGGSISLLITGDEEADAINGTVKVLEWMKNNNHIPDVALVGEPTNPNHIGQEIKIGRRGSLNGHITVKGKQGHVAYQQLADNPLPRLITLLDRLAGHTFDEGNAYFLPTNLEITTIDVGNSATNVIPAEGRASFNIRFNDNWSKATLMEAITNILDSSKLDYEITFDGNAESFITKPGPWSEIVASAVEKISGLRPAYTTTGGTSDARFIVKYCPVIECGAVNDSIHQINENAKVSDLNDLTQIYEEILKRYFEIT